MISRQRHVDIAPARTTVTHGAGGVAYLRSPVPLSSYPDRVSDCLERWAEAVPESRVARSACSRWTVASPHVRRRPGSRPIDCGWSARSRPVHRASDRDSFRQRNRSRHRSDGGHVRRHPLRADRPCVFSAVARFRHSAVPVRCAPAWTRVRRRRQTLRSRPAELVSAERRGHLWFPRRTRGWGSFR